jgi:Uma2 family endonuclease
MTLEQFDSQYANRKPYFEYWFGAPVQKSMPTWIHSLLQKIVMRLLDDAGYESVAELKLKISTEFQPLPDVSAVLPGQIEGPYPTRPVEIVVEILSPDDKLYDIVSKCTFYAGLGIPHIYVVDPQTRKLFSWECNAGLQSTGHLASIPVGNIWSELDRRLATLPPHLPGT